MIKDRFGSLFKELKLTPGQTDKVVQVMGDCFMKNAGKWFALPQGSLSPAEIAPAMADSKVELEKQLQPLLGEAGCARLIEYSEALSRDSVSRCQRSQDGSRTSHAHIACRPVSEKPIALGFAADGLVRLGRARPVQRRTADRR